MKKLIAHFLCIKLLKAVLKDQNEAHNYCHLKRKTKWHESVRLFIFSVMTIFTHVPKMMCHSMPVQHHHMLRADMIYPYT